jgi:hypothetical protein
MKRHEQAGSGSPMPPPAPPPSLTSDGGSKGGGFGPLSKCHRTWRDQPNRPRVTDPENASQPDDHR